MDIGRYIRRLIYGEAGSPLGCYRLTTIYYDLIIICGLSSSYSQVGHDPFVNMETSWHFGSFLLTNDQPSRRQTCLSASFTISNGTLAWSAVVFTNCITLEMSLLYWHGLMICWRHYRYVGSRIRLLCFIFWSPFVNDDVFIDVWRPSSSDYVRCFKRGDCWVTFNKNDVGASSIVYIK